MDKGSLLQKARVLRNQQYYNGSNQGSHQYARQDLNGIEVDSSLLIEFEECTSLTILNDEVMAGMEKGNIFEASTDFVIFSATNHNKYAKKQFAIDIPTFVSSMAETILSDNYNFCQACAQAQYYCGYMHAGKNSYASDGQQNSNSEQQNPYRQPENYNYQNENYSAQDRYDMYRHYNNGGGQSYGSFQSNQKSYRQQYGDYRMNGANRNLQQGHVTESVDCKTCQSVCAEQSSTYNQDSNNYDNNQGEYTNYQALEWLRGLSECEQVNYGNYYNMKGQNGNSNNQKQQQQQTYSQIYNELYAGLMCNADGTGIEVGIFMDEECSVWNPSKSFMSILVEGTLPYFYYTKTKNLVQFIFTKQIGCGETEYTVPYDDEAYDYGKNYNSYEYDKYGYSQANDGCQYLFEGNVLNIGGTCANTATDDDGNYASQGANTQDGKYTYFSSSGWSTYQYDISDQDSDYQVCTALQNQVENGETHTTSTQSKKDNLYTYNTRTTSLLEDSNLTGEDLLLIIVCSILLVTMLYYTRKRYLSQQNSRKEPLISLG
ncbi:unnamed protein product [Cylindrotheca closterium]|uniref:Uncharacterized protein n=1 Tax=Cylindrotheca closterium TaxID=2856 RepID=A0AAD2FRF6_9STRA|nr:unnamed protein product [Cylindrotheca closterium]